MLRVQCLDVCSTESYKSLRALKLTKMKTSIGILLILCCQGFNAEEDLALVAVHHDEFEAANDQQWAKLIVPIDLGPSLKLIEELQGFGAALTQKKMKKDMTESLAVFLDFGWSMLEQITDGLWPDIQQMIQDTTPQEMDLDASNRMFEFGILNTEYPTFDERSPLSIEETVSTNESSYRSRLRFLEDTIQSLDKTGQLQDLTFWFSTISSELLSHMRDLYFAMDSLVSGTKFSPHFFTTHESLQLALDSLNHKAKPYNFYVPEYALNKLNNFFLSIQSATSIRVTIRIPLQYDSTRGEKRITSHRHQFTLGKPKEVVGESESGVSSVDLNEIAQILRPAKYPKPLDVFAMRRYIEEQTANSYDSYAYYNVMFSVMLVASFILIFFLANCGKSSKKKKSIRFVAIQIEPKKLKKTPKRS